MFSATKLIAVAACAQSAFAALYMTSPVASTVWTAGQPQQISWQDDGQTYNLQAFGQASVSIGVGNAIQQTNLQTVVENVDVSTTSTIQFTPDPSIGPSGAYYFIRIQSNAMKDPAQPQYPALAFSAKFMMTGMSGQFNATVQQQVDGASTAPIGGGPTPAAPSPQNAAVTTTPTTSKPTSASSASASPSGAGAAKESGAQGLIASGVAAVVGTVFAATLLL